MSIEPIYKKINVFTIHALINSDMSIDRLCTLINRYDVNDTQSSNKKRRFDRIYKATYYSTPSFSFEKFSKNSDILDSVFLKELLKSLENKERVEIRSLNSVAISIINGVINRKYPNLIYRIDYNQVKFIPMDNLKIIPLEDLVTRYYYENIAFVNYKNILSLFGYDIEPAYSEVEKTMIDFLTKREHIDFADLGEVAIMVDKCIDHIRDEIIEVDIIDYFEENLPLKSFPYKNLGINIDGSFEKIDMRNMCNSLNYYREFLGNQLLATIIYAIETCKGEDDRLGSVLSFIEYITEEKRELLNNDNPFLHSYIDKIKREIGLKKIENNNSKEALSKGALLIREISADIKSEIP